MIKKLSYDLTELTKNVTCDYRIFTFDESLVLLDTLYLYVLEVNPVIQDLLRVCEEETPEGYKWLCNHYDLGILEEHVEILQKLKSHGVIFHPKFQLTGRPAFQNYEMNFPTVHRCNMRCKYCFADCGENYNYAHAPRKMSWETVRKAMNYMMYDFGKEGATFRFDFVSGGEPLLNFDLYRKVKDYSKQLIQDTNKCIQVWLCTNGTLFQEDMLKSLSDYHQQIGISLDGVREKHDRVRVMQDGSGSYDKVIGAIHNIKQNPKFSEAFKDIWALSVLTSENHDLIEILKHHKSLGINTVQIKVVRLPKTHPLAVTEDNITEIERSYEELVDFFCEEACMGKTDYLRMILNDNDYFGKIIIRIILQEAIIYRCGAGKAKLAVTSDGKLFPCDSFVGDNRFLLGDLESGVDPEKADCFWKAHVFGREACSICWNRHICGGDCYYNSVKVTGDICECDTTMCRLMKFYTRLAIKLLYFLQTHCRREYEKVVQYVKFRRRIRMGQNKPNK